MHTTKNRRRITEKSSYSDIILGAAELTPPRQHKKPNKVLTIKRMSSTKILSDTTN
jgi:hypothetical protein